MKRSLMRPASALFPIVLLLAALFGNSTMVANLYLYYCVIQLFSLCSVDSFRNAASREPGVKRVDRRFSGTWLLIALGIAVCSGIDRFTKIGQNQIMLVAAAGSIILEQLFEERMRALSHPSDGAILSVVANILLLAGLMIDSSEGMAAPVNLTGFYTACGAGLGMLISIIASYIIEPVHAFSLVPRNIGFFPKACVQTLLYPVAAAFFLGLNVAYFAGLILWRLSRTVCRRAADESRPLNLLLMATSVLAVAAAMYQPLIGFSIAVAVATLCAVVVFCAPGWRIYIGTVLVMLANAQLFVKTSMPQEWNILPTEWMFPFVCICCAIAILLNLHKAFLKKV